MKITKKVARKFVYPTLLNLSYDKVLRRFSGKKGLNVMYHGVIQQEGAYFSPRHIRLNEFEQHLKYYKNNFNLIHVSELFKRREKQQPIAPNTLTISFDDGFLNNYEIALPLIEKYEIPVTYFISSLCATETAFPVLWPEIVAALLYFYPNEPVKLKAHTFINLFEAKTGTSMFTYLKSLNSKERDREIESLVTSYNIHEKLKTIPSELWKLMDREMLLKLSCSKHVEIGSHGHNHYNLGNIEIEKAKEEIYYSKSLLEEVINKEVALIAYPDGSYNHSVLDIAQKAGYKGQVIVNPNTPTDLTDPRLITRYGMATSSTFESNMFFMNRAFKTKGFNS